MLKLPRARHCVHHLGSHWGGTPRRRVRLRSSRRDDRLVGPVLSYTVVGVLLPSITLAVMSAVRRHGYTISFFAQFNLGTQ
jgi:hypothetical protein